jgi:predicted DNA binding CopG/RHH family protein
MKLDADEKELLESVERGEWKSAGGGKRERTRYSRYAKATFRKDRRLNIRLSSKDLEPIQKRALPDGWPHQTLIASLRHKDAAGRLVGEPIPIRAGYRGYPRQDRLQPGRAHQQHLDDGASATYQVTTRNLPMWRGSPLLTPRQHRIHPGDEPGELRDVLPKELLGGLVGNTAVLCDQAAFELNVRLDGIHQR